MIDDLAGRLLAGDRRALARLLTLAERDPDSWPRSSARCIHTRAAPTPSGSQGLRGRQSTLVNGFVRVLREEGKSVGVLAVDPSSPFTGGAVLGDRIRMQAHYWTTGCSSGAWRLAARTGGCPPSPERR